MYVTETYQATAVARKKETLFYSWHQERETTREIYTLSYLAAIQMCLAVILLLDAILGLHR
jgi:hypothetical protein